MAGTGFSNFDDAFESATTKPKYASEGTKSLPDGEYEVEVTAGVAKATADGGQVFSILMIVLTDGSYKGWKIEKAIFLTKKEGTEEDKAAFTQKRMGELKSDLSLMGFDVGNWTKANKRPFGAQLEIACEVMKGVRLKIRKKTNEPHVNIYLNKRLDDSKPKAFGPAEMVAPPKAPAPADASFGADPFAPAGPGAVPPPSSPGPDTVPW